MIVGQLARRVIDSLYVMFYVEFKKSNNNTEEFNGKVKSANIVFDIGYKCYIVEYWKCLCIKNATAIKFTISCLHIVNDIRREHIFMECGVHRVLRGKNTAHLTIFYTNTIFEYRLRYTRQYLTFELELIVELLLMLEFLTLLLIFSYSMW